MDEHNKFDSIDIRNAVRLLHDYCKSKGASCIGCCIRKTSGPCPLAIVPEAWEIDENDSRD